MDLQKNLIIDIQLVQVRKCINHIMPMHKKIPEKKNCQQSMPHLFQIKLFKIIMVL